MPNKPTPFGSSKQKTKKTNRTRPTTNRTRPTSASRGYGHRWRQATRVFLAEHDYECNSCGGVANTVDHIKPHRGQLELFWDQSNWQALCPSCHGKKTAAGE